MTFDQPLWQKATEITMPKSINVVVILGGFYTLMSFVGSIGNFMSGSGLNEALQTIYGENTVNKMLGGKAIALGFRGLILTESALTIQIQKLVMVDQKIEQQDIESLKSQYQKFMNGEITAELIQMF